MSMQIAPIDPPESISTISEAEQTIFEDLLYLLGITSKYVGYHYLSYAILLVLHQPDRLWLVTKWLYPDVAKHFLTDWRTIERGMRFAINVAWSTRHEKLQSISQNYLDYRPNITEFIMFNSTSFIFFKSLSYFMLW